MLKFGVLGYSIKIVFPFSRPVCVCSQTITFIFIEVMAPQGKVDNLSVILGALAIEGGNQLQLVLCCDFYTSAHIHGHM